MSMILSRYHITRYLTQYTKSECKTSVRLGSHERLAHNSPMPLVSYMEKIDRDISGAHCIILSIYHTKNDVTAICKEKILYSSSKISCWLRLGIYYMYIKFLDHILWTSLRLALFLSYRKWQDYVYIQCEYKSTKQKIKHLLREENKVKENKIS